MANKPNGESLKQDVQIAISKMCLSCFGYEPDKDVLERTTMQIFFSLSPMLGNKNKGLEEE